MKIKNHLWNIFDHIVCGVLQYPQYNTPEIIVKALNQTKRKNVCWWSPYKFVVQSARFFTGYIQFHVTIPGVSDSGLSGSRTSDHKYWTDHLFVLEWSYASILFCPCSYLHVEVVICVISAGQYDLFMVDLFHHLTDNWEFSMVQAGSTNLAWRTSPGWKYYLGQALGFLFSFF